MSKAEERIRARFRAFGRTYPKMVHHVENLGDGFTIENQKLDSSTRGVAKRNLGFDTYYLKHGSTVLATANEIFEVTLAEAFEHHNEVLDFL